MCKIRKAALLKNYGPCLHGMMPVGVQQVTQRLLPWGGPMYQLALWGLLKRTIFLQFYNVFLPTWWKLSKAAQALPSQQGLTCAWNMLINVLNVHSIKASTGWLGKLNWEEEWCYLGERTSFITFIKCYHQRIQSIFSKMHSKSLQYLLEKNHLSKLGLLENFN